MTNYCRKAVWIAFGLAVIAAGCLTVVRLREPVWQGKRLSGWIQELKVSLKVVEYPDVKVTQVFLANLSDEEVLLLNPRTPNKLQFAPLGLFFFYTNALVLDGFTVASKHESESAPASAALRHLGTRALAELITGLNRRDSKVADFFNVRVWHLLPTRVQAMLGKPFHPAHIRLNCAFGLGELGAAARPAVPQLKKLLTDPDPHVRAAALEALQRIDPATIGLFHPDLFLSRDELANQPRGLPNRNGETNSMWQTHLQFLPGTPPDFFDRELEFRRNNMEIGQATSNNSNSLWRSRPTLIQAPSR
jgi:hypothetical protein